MRKGRQRGVRVGLWWDSARSGPVRRILLAVLKDGHMEGLSHHNEVKRVRRASIDGGEREIAAYRHAPVKVEIDVKVLWVVERTRLRVY